ncbi:hypothetical protein CTAYLR_000385 [Chrysophaeum taylorii]|uniref:Uncharacterized protein n=1 Tax=Chrysophaeum taylorii TaxID=2483200 RepID=A0AAD7UG84_9STRA|nr:hypothetical protein CTAYLR_000385 [Chrysophaeum taylorii]
MTLWPALWVDVVVSSAEKEGWLGCGRFVEEMRSAHDFYETRRVAVSTPAECEGPVAGAYGGRSFDPRWWWPTVGCALNVTVESWDSACSGRPELECCRLDLTPLRLPVVREVAIRIDDAVLLQDGFLRPFDVPTCLWPGSYLLSRFLKSNDLKGRRALELGTGTGLGAVAACRAGATVVATDVDPNSLRLAEANLKAHCDRDDWRVQFLDWRDYHPPTSEKFDLVVGASLQFDDPAAWGTTSLATVFDAFLAPGGLAVLVRAHGDSALATLDSIFIVDRRLPATRFGMMDADFEILTLRRRA